MTAMIMWMSHEHIVVMFQVLGSPVTKAKVDVEDGIRSHLFFKLRSHFLICSYIYICDEDSETGQIQAKGPSGEGRRPKWRRTKPLSGER